jgi:RNA polymerase sigma-70 factor (sigma-E family)
VTGAVDFDGFVRMNSHALLKSAYLLTGNRADAEELVQDTLVRLYPKWQHVEVAAVPLAYVRRSLINNFVSGTRSPSRRDLLVAEVPDVRTAVDSAGAVDDRAVIRTLLAGLSPKQRAVMVLRYYFDLTDAQIAAELGCREGTVRSILSRTLASLRADLPVADRRSS